jgi:excisionase family DNA binding protein
MKKTKTPDAEGVTSRLALSPTEAANALGVSRITIWRMIERGELKTFHVSARCRRIPVTEIERYIAERLESESA